METFGRYIRTTSPKRVNFTESESFRGESQSPVEGEELQSAITMDFNY
uniref:Uncharacterized protein n=1 Tax=Zea mays TaxID=4577 RepID=B4FM24_MAIZE|nr:unknown [Zea mays]